MTLDALIRELRTELQDETWAAGKLHYGVKVRRVKRGGVGRGNLGAELNGSVPPPSAVQGSESGWTGLRYTPNSERLFGSPDGWGEVFLARASVQEISDRCHGRHRPHHERPGDRYGLCARLTFRVVEMAQPVPFAAERMGLELEVAEDILLKALTHAAEWRHNRLDDLRQAARVERSAEFIPQEQFIIDHDLTDWERQKWEALREGYHLPPWEIEWERRLAQHAKYGCSRCERVAA